MALGCAVFLVRSASGALWRERRGAAELLGIGVAETCEALGPAFLKVAQLLSLRTDVLPEEFARPLRRLQDAVRPLPLGGLRGELGSLAPAFAWIEPEPRGSASIAQVHRARLAATGEIVALKIRRPGVVSRMRSDLCIAAWIVGLAARLPVLRDVPVAAAFQQVASAVWNQLDLQREARTLEQLGHGLRRHEGILVPVPRRELGSQSALVMNWFDGLQRIDGPDADRGRVRVAVISTLRAFYAMVFELGVVHCDLHPGNVFVRGDEVVILDAGYSAFLSASDRSSFREFFLGMVFEDGRQCARVLIETATVVPPELDRERFVRRVQELIDRTSRTSSRRFDVTAFVVGLFSILRSFRVAGSPAFTTTLVAFLTLEGLIRASGEDIDFRREAAPFVSGAILEAARL